MPKRFFSASWLSLLSTKRTRIIIMHSVYQVARQPRNYPCFATLTLDSPRTCACFQKLWEAQGYRLR